MRKIFFCLTSYMFITSVYAGGGGKTSHRDNTALFPPKQANASLATPPAVPKLEAPAFSASVAAGTVELKWQPVEKADFYHVQVAKDVNFKWLIHDANNLSATSFQAANIEAGKKYFWRVAAWKKSNMAATNKSEFAKSFFEVQ